MVVGQNGQPIHHAHHHVVMALEKDVEHAHNLHKHLEVNHVKEKAWIGSIVIVR